MIKFYSIYKSDFKIKNKILNSIKNVINKNNFILGKEVDEFESWAEAESQKDAYLGGYSEEHIKQMTDPKHNQWGVAGEPKKSGVH